MPTPSPTTPAPTSKRPTSASTVFPTETPSNGPTRQATSRPTRKPSIAPVSAPLPSAVPSQTYQPSPRNLQTVFPSSPIPVEDVPITPFAVSLAFTDPLSQSDVEASASELQTVLSDYLLRELAGQDLPGGIAFTDFNLTVSPSGNSTRSIASRRRVRKLQDETVYQIYNYTVGGTADVSNPGGEGVQSGALTRSVDSSINSAFGGSEKQAELSSYVQDHPDSNVLSNAVQTGVVTQALPPENGGTKKPTIVAIVFGFILVFLAVLSLLFYAVTFWKGYKKRAAQRKRERQGVHAVSTKASQINGQTPQPAQAQAVPGFLASSSIRPVKEDSSEEGSSYQGVDSDSEKGSDAFARELKLAASLDKRAWEDYQRKLKSLEHQGLVLGNEPETSRSIGRAAGASSGRALDGAGMYGTSYDPDDESDTDEGFEITDAGSTLIIGPVETESDDYRSVISGNTFPYGDEDARRIDPPGPRSSSIQPKRAVDDPTGFRVSQLAISTIEEEGIEHTKEDFAQSPVEDRSDDSYDPAFYLMNTLTRNTTLVSAQARDAPSEVPRASPTQSLTSSFQSSQAVQMSQTSLEKNSRGSLSAEPMSPEVVKRLSMEDEDSELQDPSKDSNSFQSLMTIDIVKEVQKLASFVKNYELKREKDKLKEGEHSAWSERSGRDPRSLRISYDAVNTNAVSADRDIGSRTLSTAYDDDSLSESSQSDWSSDGDYGPKGRQRFQKRSFAPRSGPAVDDENDESSTESENDLQTSAQGSDDSRLGIHPFNVQQIMAAQPDVEASRRRIAARLASQPVDRTPIPKPVSKPPVTGNAYTSTLLSPIPATPDSHVDYDEESPPQRRAPLDDISRNPIRTPDTRKDVRRSPKMSSPTAPENYQTGSSEKNHGRSPLPKSGSSASDRKASVVPPENANDLIEENRRRSRGANIPSQALPPKAPSSWEKKMGLNSLRKHGAIVDEDAEIMSAMAPSDEERTRDGSHQQVAASSGTKGTARRSGNKGFNNIISMFESKPKEAIFPPNENWQYNF